MNSSESQTRILLDVNFRLNKHANFTIGFTIFHTAKSRIFVRSLIPDLILVIVPQLG